MKSKTFRLRYIYFFVLFILLEVVLVSALTYNKNFHINDIQNRHIKKLQTQLKTVISFYSTTSTIVIDEILNNENIKTLLLELNTTDESKQKELRDKLLITIQQTYDRLTNHGFRQLHFHDKNGNSFLRFHSVKNYGDNLFPFRS